MDTIEVSLGDRSYEVLIKRGMLADAGPEGGAARVAALAAGGRIAFVCGENAWDPCGSAFFDMLKAAAAGAAETLEGVNGGAYQEPFAVLIPPGEQSKTINEYTRIAERFAEEELDRDGLIVCLGGEVTSDLAGFAAATWRRGIRYVRIPTTLLAMVDTSVGGKTAIDIPAGRKLLGAFHQPSLVLIDPDCLLSLPGRELRSGMAEVIKYGAIESESLYERLEAITTDGGVPMAVFSSIIEACIGIKTEIIAKDEYDRSSWAVLDFGHTFARAIELKYGPGKYTHGEAVAIGMRIAARYGEAIGVTESGTAERLDTLLDRWGLPGIGQTDGLIELIPKDKKLKGDAVNLVLLKHMGNAGIYRTQLSGLKAGLEALTV